jgi:RNA polymerase sigma-70 factor, ECF subfamily
MKQILDEAVRPLLEVYGSVYKLRAIDERPGDEVARQLGISRTAMKSRLHRARELVRRHLGATLAGPLRGGET